jgi:hypothetical protein
VMAGDGIGRLLGALLEHFGFLPENRCIRHGSLLSRRHLEIGRANPRNRRTIVLHDRVSRSINNRLQSLGL